MEPPICKNIRSRRIPDQRCPNPATHGDYCGIHFKFPRPFKTAIEQALVVATNEIIPPSTPNMNFVPKAIEIQKWWRLYGRLRIRSRQGPARYTRNVATNTTDFYSMEDISGVEGIYLFSFFDASDKHVYAFDIRSFSSLLEKSQEVQNPYTRQVIPTTILEKAAKFVRWCRRKGISTRWAPIEAATPEQRFHVKVTDLFQKIDELNYYTNPDWFINLTVDKLRCFYVELFDIWYHRAELSVGRRNVIIPPPARPFRYPVREIVTMRSLEFLRKTNMDIIRMFISAAEDKSDRILGAMYVVTALTLVSRPCAEMYPWLFESATPGIYERYRTMTDEDNLDAHAVNAINYLNAILNMNHIPPLALPPPPGAAQENDAPAPPPVFLAPLHAIAQINLLLPPPSPIGVPAVDASGAQADQPEIAQGAAPELPQLAQPQLAQAPAQSILTPLDSPLLIPVLPNLSEEDTDVEMN